MGQGVEKYGDMRQGYFVNMILDMGKNKRLRNATLVFLKIDRRHGDPRSSASDGGVTVRKGSIKAGVSLLG